MPKVTKNYNPSFNSNRSNNEIVKLAKKGDSIIIRVADYPVYYGQHWLEAEKKYAPCPRINSVDLNNPDSCEYCEKYNQDKQAKVENPEFRPKISFVFPAIDKNTHKAIFFETSQMVWTEMVNAEQKGIKIFDYDWMIERTENLPKFYDITRLEKDPLDQLDAEAYKEAKAMDTEALINYRLGRTKKTEQIEEPQTFDGMVDSISEDLDEGAPDEIPF